MITPFLAKSPPPFNRLNIVQAAGEMLYDSKGLEYIDLTSGFGVAALGYSNAIIHKAISDQYTKLSHGIPSLIRYENDDLACVKIAQCLGFEDAGVVLTTGGAEAVEVAVKASYLRTNKKGVAILSGAYHGQSIGVLGMIDQDTLTAPFGETIPAVSKLIIPYPKRNNCFDIKESENKSIDYLEKILKSGEVEGGIGTIIVEPIQNLAGYRECSSRFLSKISDVCRKHNVTVIADEIFTGFGRCGGVIVNSGV